MMSIALNPIVNGYHSTDSDHVDLATVTQNNLAGSRSTGGSQASGRISASGLEFISTFLTLAISGALLAFAGWLCLEFLASLQAQLESLNTMQLLRALAGA